MSGDEPSPGKGPPRKPRNRSHERHVGPNVRSGASLSFAAGTEVPAYFEPGVPATKATKSRRLRITKIDPQPQEHPSGVLPSLPCFVSFVAFRFRGGPVDDSFDVSLDR